MSGAVPEFSRPQKADQVSAAGLTRDIAATVPECRALAMRLGVLDVSALSANLRLKSLGGGKRVRVDGVLTAQVIQACVVTLDPVPATIEERFTLFFAEEDPGDAGGDVDIFMDEDDPPDPIIDGIIDLGELVTEHLALALDPFPRKGGIQFESGDDEPEPVVEKSSPFAVLASLRKNKG